MPTKEKRQPRRRPETVEDLYEDEQLHRDFVTDKSVYAWLQKRHTKVQPFIDAEGYYRRHGHEWKVPYGVRIALKTQLSWNQLANQYPFYVTWVSPKTGKRLKKYFMSLPSAIIFTAEKAQYVDPKSTIVSRHGYYVPPKLRGKIPVPYKWCPCCMKAVRFRRVTPQVEFFAMRKEWNNEKNRYEYMDRRVALLICTTCGITNRDQKYRRSNQPWEVRKFKKGVRRAKRRK